MLPDMKFNKSIFDKLFNYLLDWKDFFLDKFGKTVYKDVFVNEKIFWKRVNHNYEIYSFIDRNDKNVWLDYGSGWGFFAFCLAGFGANKIIGIDIRKNEIKIANKIKKDIFPNKDISFIHRSVLDYKEKVDVVSFNNVLSHVKLPIEYIVKSYNLLNYSGVISICDNNNSLSLKVQIRNRKLWKNNEEKLTKIREKIFTNMGINSSKARYYAKFTNGLSKEDCIKLISSSSSKDIDHYLQNRERIMPTQWIDPDFVDERIICPFIYKQILFDMGFECIKIKPICFNFPKIASLLNTFKIGFLLLPAFHMVAEKRRLPSP